MKHLQPNMVETPSVDENELWLTDFENDDLVYFFKDVGLSINIAKQSLVVFEQIGGEWFDDKMPLSDLRDAYDINLTPAHHYGNRERSASRGVGQAVGLSIVNSIERSRARRGTGIELRFRSIDRPRFLFNITDSQERSKVMEALRQVLSDGQVKTPLRVIPFDVQDAYTPLTQEDIAEQEALEQRNKLRRDKTRLNLRDYVRIMLFGILGILPIHLFIQHNVSIREGYNIKFEAFGAFVYFLIGVVVGWLLVATFKLFKFWLWEARQDNAIPPEGQHQAAR